MKKAFELLPFILGAYEFLSHAIPTDKNYSIVRKVGSVLVSISELFNRVGKKPGAVSLILIVTLSTLSCSVIKDTKCASLKYVSVTYITKDNVAYTVQVPYCDTIITSKSILELRKTVKK